MCIYYQWSIESPLLCIRCDHTELALYTHKGQMKVENIQH